LSRTKAVIRIGKKTKIATEMKTKTTEMKTKTTEIKIKINN